MTERYGKLPSRDESFAACRSALSDSLQISTDRALLAHGDSLALCKAMPDDSVSLILTDPPYHSTKKANIVGDKAFQEDVDFIRWMANYAEEWKRILRPNGTIYLFCSSQMSARLEVAFSKFFRPIAHITWTKPNLPGYDGWKGKMKKEALRSWYPHSERILVFEHGGYGNWEAYRRSPLGEFLREMRLQSGMSMNALAEVTGAYGRVNHGGAVANWEAGRNIPNAEQYAKICEAIEGTGRVDSMPPYEDVVRPMFLNGNIEFTDVWNFPSVKPFKGKHPAEKPQDMLQHIVRASSYPGDVVLDCFAGSGSTGVAALTLDRRSIAMEIEEKWIERAASDFEFLERSAEQKSNGPRPEEAGSDESPAGLNGSDHDEVLF